MKRAQPQSWFGAGARLGAAAALALAARAAAQDLPPLPVEASGDRVVQVKLPGATCAAVSDAHRLLAVGFGAGGPGVTLIPVGDRGLVQGAAPVSLALPRPAGAPAPYALGLVFHPRLPLLYVWQDAAAKPDDPALKEFDHLVVVDVAARPLAVAAAAARGPDCAAGQAAGAIQVDPLGKRLFVPNLLVAGHPAVGYVPLASNGLPHTVEGKPALVARDCFDWMPLPTGYGFVAASERVVTFSCHYGLCTWDTGNRLAALSRVLVPGMPGVLGALGGTAKGPLLYWATVNAGGVFAMEQVDGYPTLLPKTLSISGGSFKSVPVPMGGARPALAIGGERSVHVIALRPDGWFEGSSEQIAAAKEAVTALAYSEKFDRLYVPVEALP